jgi:hypothetical protein
MVGELFVRLKVVQNSAPRMTVFRRDSMADISKFSIIAYERKPGHWLAAIIPKGCSVIVDAAETVRILPLYQISSRGRAGSKLLNEPELIQALFASERPIDSLFSGGHGGNAVAFCAGCRRVRIDPDRPSPRAARASFADYLPNLIFDAAKFHAPHCSDATHDCYYCKREIEVERQMRSRNFQLCEVWSCSGISQSIINTPPAWAYCVMSTCDLKRTADHLSALIKQRATRTVGSEMTMLLYPTNDAWEFMISPGKSVGEPA